MEIEQQQQQQEEEEDGEKAAARGLSNKKVAASGELDAGVPCDSVPGDLPGPLFWRAEAVNTRKRMRGAVPRR